MKLRNKKTGDVWEFDGISMAISDSTKEKLGARGYSGSCYARSLSELTEGWEDYKPAEPLIKDEKIRKAVRAWADANKVFGASTYRSCIGGHYWYIRAFDDTERGIDIDLWGELPKELIDCKYYTIDELCGGEGEE